MPLATVVGVLVLIAIVLWGLEQFPAMDATLKKIIWVLIIVCVAVWLFSIIFPGVMTSLRVPSFK